MRIVRLAILIVMVCSMLTGCKKKTTTGKPTTDKKITATVCGAATCTVVVHVSANCNPVDAAMTALDHLNVEPGNTVCVFNDATGSVTLSFPTALIASPADASAPYQEFTLATGACASFVIADSAKNQTFGYQITGASCPAGGGEHANPDVIVGGGSGGGG